MSDRKKLHTTNYADTFIEVAEDTKAIVGVEPISKNGKKTIAELQYDLIANNSYTYTSDDIFFKIYAEKNDLMETELEKAREEFFSKGQPCFRASVLGKTYGFGIHCDNNSKVALYGVETDAYQKFLDNTGVKKVKAMRTSKK